jgi:hypothetical protein
MSAWVERIGLSDTPAYRARARGGALLPRGRCVSSVPGASPRRAVTAARPPKYTPLGEIGR